MEAEFDPDQPLRDDIRLLGRLLGDTVREQEGNAAFELVERVRQSSIAFRRDDDVAARRELERILDELSREETMVVVRSFSYFSHLANLAEDLDNIRRGRQSEIAGDRLPTAAWCVRSTGSRRPASAPRRCGNSSVPPQIVPVLTAHPTEVQRKSVRDLEMKIERLLRARDRSRLTPRERATGDEAVRRAVLALWQTRMLRLEKLGVIDEVANGLSFFEQTFLPQVPAMYGALEDELERRHPGRRWTDVPSGLRIGSWIGGDRDGNPFVNEAVLRRTLRMQSSRVFEHYLDGTSRARRRVVRHHPGCTGLARTAGAGRALPGREPAPSRRAVPTRAHGRLRARRGDDPRAGPVRAAAACGRRCSALREPRGVRRGP